MPDRKAERHAVGPHHSLLQKKQLILAQNIEKLYLTFLRHSFIFLYRQALILLFCITFVENY
jgi:hypothetical protein